jgi:hypothetical protein
MEALGGERRYSSYSFTTSALDGSEWSASRPGRALPLGKGPPVPIVQEAGWAPEPVWTQRLEEKSFAPAGDRTQFIKNAWQGYLKWKSHSFILITARARARTHTYFPNIKSIAEATWMWSVHIKEK